MTIGYYYSCIMLLTKFVWWTLIGKGNWSSSFGTLFGVMIKDIFTEGIRL